MGVLDKLDQATPSRKTVSICLDGAAEAEWENAYASLEAAALDDDKAGAGSIANPAPKTTAVVERMETIRARMLASEVTFLFERLEWTARLTLQAEHPPREDHVGDQLRGYNIETYSRAIIKASCISVTDSDGDVATEIPDQQWATLLGSPAEPAKDGKRKKAVVVGTLNAKQFGQLFEAATGVNDGTTRIPSSARSFLVSQDSGASLAEPSPGTSRRSGTAAGSRRTSRKSSATKKAPTKARSGGS